MYLLYQTNLFKRQGENEKKTLDQRSLKNLSNFKLMNFIIIIIMYLYSAQYLHILQDSKRYLTNPTVQVQHQLTSN